MTDHTSLIAEARKLTECECDQEGMAMPECGTHGDHVALLIHLLADSLEAVLPPALSPYRGMILEDVETGELWVYDPIDEGMEWIGTLSEALSEVFIAKRFAAGELTIFTPEVP